jgi:hypothetical protein
MEADRYWQRPLSIGQQICGMKRFFAQFRPFLFRNSVTWFGPIKPHDCAAPYNIKIQYNLGLTPRIWAISPPLVPNVRGEIPHLYTDGSLCLHLPSEWSPKHLIASTIVPWISDWLVHYEIWRATEHWEGGGSHPRSRRQRAKQ